MKKLNFKTISMYIARILIISIIFASLPIRFCTNVATADSGLTAEQLDKMKSDIATWIDDNDDKPTVMEYKYTENGVEQITYAMLMPEINTKDYNISYDSNASRYIYIVKDGDGNVVKQVPFNLEVLMNADSAIPLPAKEEININNYKTYLGTSENSAVLEAENGDLLKVLNLDEHKERQIIFAVELEDGTLIVGENNISEFKEESLGKKFLDWIRNALSWLADTVFGAILKIINDLLLTISDGIQVLIDGLFGSEEKVTVYKVVFGKLDKLSINFWAKDEVSSNTENPTGEEEENAPGIVDNAPAPTLKKVVDYWYGVLRGIAIAVYLVMLGYIGVRILLSSTGKSSQKYKDMLSSWAVGIVILTLYPYVMRYTVVINDMFVQMIDIAPESTEEKTEEEKSEGAEKEEDKEDEEKSEDAKKKHNQADTMLAIRQEAERDNNIALTIVYIIMLGQLIVLIGVYYKRVFMMAFLITIFPIVATLYVWEKTKGGSKSLGTWTREYVILVLTQTFHAVVYVVLIEGAFGAFNENGNWFIFILSVTYLFEAEKVIRAIFGMKSSAGTIGDLAAAGAAAWGASKAIGKVLKGDSKDKTDKDTKDRNEADETIEEARRNETVNRTLAANTPRSLNASSGSSAGGGGSSGGGSAGGGTPGGGSPGSGGATGTNTPNNPYENLQAAQAQVSRDGYHKRTKRGILSRAVGATSRAAGITLGLTSGMATGSMKEGFKNAAIGNEIGGMVATLPKGIVGFARGAFSGQIMKMKVRSGAMDEQLKELGFDLGGQFDIDPHISSAKAEIIREALAAQAAAARRGGKQAGELAFMKAIEKGRKKENL